MKTIVSALVLIAAGCSHSNTSLQQSEKVDQGSVSAKALANDPEVPEPVPTGLFIALQTKDEGAYQVAWDSVGHLLDRAHCQVFRSGAIQGAQGNATWAAANRFEVFQCSEPVLDDLISSGIVDSLSSAGLDVRLAEGPLKRMVPGCGASGGAELITKVSYFRRLDPQLRNADLAALRELAQSRPDVWIPDAVMVPAIAHGMVRPDEFAFICYSELGQGERFRENNADILERIGAFNQKHVSAFTYVGAVPNSDEPKGSPQ